MILPIGDQLDHISHADLVALESVINFRECHTKNGLRKPAFDEGKVMLDEFENWFSTHQPSLKERGFSVQVVRPDADVDKKGAYADIGAKDFVARVTVWDSGEYEQEAIEVKTEEAKLAEYHVCKSPTELAPLLEEFLKKLESLSN
ncbi:MAG TPA: hypothetical protein VJ810_03180 [Blastocatellia bacterium]|nr:hypothetical protein [Blastocatellia bacterium]